MILLPRRGTGEGYKYGSHLTTLDAKIVHFSLSLSVGGQSGSGLPMRTRLIEAVQPCKLSTAPFASESLKDLALTPNLSVGGFSLFITENNIIHSVKKGSWGPYFDVSSSGSHGCCTPKDE